MNRLVNSRVAISINGRLRCLQDCLSMLACLHAISMHRMLMQIVQFPGMDLRPYHVAASKSWVVLLLRLILKCNSSNVRSQTPHVSEVHSSHGAC